ncbi:AMP-binding protein [Streptomyces sp. PG2]
MLRRCIEEIGCALAQIYGLTETGNTAVCLPPAEHYPGNPLLHAAGRPYPGFEVKIVDRSGTALPGVPRARSVCGHLPAWSSTGAVRRRPPRRSGTAGSTPATSATWTRRDTSTCGTG